jgi:hypothetical protein
MAKSATAKAAVKKSPAKVAKADEAPAKAPAKRASKAAQALTEAPAARSKRGAAGTSTKSIGKAAGKTAVSRTPAAAAAKPAAKTAAPKARSAGKAGSAAKAGTKTALKPAAKAGKAGGDGATVNTKTLTAVAKAARKTAAKAGARPAAVRKPAPAANVRVNGTDDTDGKPRLVRDSFTMPEREYAVLAEVKQACLKAGFEIKKSELLRIGVALISQIDLATLQSVLASLPQLKTGRPRSR